mgnify:CR=1 FL=1
MIILLSVSLVINLLLVWYIRELLAKHWIDGVIVEKFADMINQYRESLEAIYRLEELYGEEVLKKAVYQTRFVQEACEEFEALLKTKGQENNEEGGEEDPEEGDQEPEKNGEGQEVIRIKEGETVSQDAASYKRVIPDI